MNKEKKYKCDCGMFVATKLPNGYIKINTKCKGIMANGKVMKFTCTCKKEFEIKIEK